MYLFQVKSVYFGGYNKQPVRLSPTPDNHIICVKAMLLFVNMVAVATETFISLR